MRTNYILCLFAMIFFMTSCLSDKPVQDGLASIDVRKNYPEKEIFLTDIADVTYLHLSTADDDYLYKGSIRDLTENTIVVVDNVSMSILFFTKDGNPKSRFNCRGQGPEEYFEVFDVIYDEAADDVFVVVGRNTIQVYSSTGMYKRRISLPQGKHILHPIVFDDHSLFFYDYTIEYDRALALLRGSDLPEINKYVIPFYRISKADGEVLDYVELPGTHLFMGINYHGMWLSASRRYSAKCPEGVLLWSPGTDTVFLYSGDKSLTPVLYQTPSLVSLNPMEYLLHCLNRGQYQFIQVLIVREGDVYPGIFPAKYYMRNKKTEEIIRPKFLLPDYKEKEFIISSSESGGSDYENGYYFELDLYELKQAYRENKLGGKLKDLVASLNEDEDNNVFMLVEFK